MHLYLNDGSAVLVLMSEEKAKEKGLQPLARIVGYSVAGVDPKIMGIVNSTSNS